MPAAVRSRWFKLYICMYRDLLAVLVVPAHRRSARADLPCLTFHLTQAPKKGKVGLKYSESDEAAGRQHMGESAFCNAGTRLDP